MELRNTSTTSIYIAWRPPNVTTIQGSLLGYRIYYKKQKDPSLLMLTASLPASATEIEIKDLEVFTNYTVRLCTFSSSGNGLPSIAHYVRTDEDGTLTLSTLERGEKGKEGEGGEWGWGGKCPRQL